MVGSFILAYTLPRLVENAKILLQGVPAHLVDELAKKVREAATVEGVLETRKSHFWALNSNQYVGSLSVRVSRDCDTQTVLLKVQKLFSPLLQYITVQIEKHSF